MKFHRDGRKMKFRRERFPDFMEFISEQTCIKCGRYGVEVAHCGSHGMGQRPSDLTCLPICPEHHRLDKDSYHSIGSKVFFDYHRLDKDALMAKYQTMFYGEAIAS